MNTETITNRNAAGEIEKSAMANCLMILNAHQNAVVTSVFGKADEEVVVGRMFECKTCNRKFSSFQALGGHRASHKKTKPPLSGEVSDDVKSPSKPKAHACKICGAEFPIGQALGGHMRRHRENLEGHDGNNAAKTGEVEIDEKKLSAMSSVTTEGSSGNSDGNDGGIAGNKRKINDDGVVSEVPVSNNLSSKRVCLDLLLWWNNEQLEEYAAATAENNNDDDVNKKINDDVKNDDNEIEEGEIVEEHEEEGERFVEAGIEVASSVIIC